MTSILPTSVIFRLAQKSGLDRKYVATFEISDPINPQSECFSNFLRQVNLPVLHFWMQFPSEAEFNHKRKIWISWHNPILHKKSDALLEISVSHKKSMLPLSDFWAQCSWTVDFTPKPQIWIMEPKFGLDLKFDEIFKVRNQIYANIHICQIEWCLDFLKQNALAYFRF